MGLEDVKEGLEEELEQERSEILDEAEEEKQRILDEADAELEDYREKKEQEAEERIQTLERSEIAGTRLRMKKKLLKAKKEAIDEVFAEAEDRISSYKPDKREEIIEALIEKAEEEIDVEKIYCAGKDTKLIDDYEAVKDDSIEGGILCEDPEGESRVDLTLSTLLDSIHEEKLKEVAEKLFE